MSELTYEREQQGDTVIVRIGGSLGIDAMQDLDNKLNQISAGRPALCVIDLSQLEFIASLAIGSIVSLHNGLKRHDGEVRLAAMSPNVADVIQRCRLGEVMSIHETVEQAMPA